MNNKSTKKVFFKDWHCLQTIKTENLEVKVKVLNIFLAGTVLSTSIFVRANPAGFDGQSTPPASTADLSIQYTIASQMENGGIQNTPVASLATIITLLDSLKPEERKALIDTAEANINTINISIAAEKPKLDEAEKKFHDGSISYYLYEASDSWGFYTAGVFTFAVSGVTWGELADKGASNAIYAKGIFLFDVALMVAGQLVQTYGFPQVKLNKIEFKKLSQRNKDLEVLLKTEREKLKLLKLRYNVQ